MTKVFPSVVRSRERSWSLVKVPSVMELLSFEFALVELG